MRRRALLMGGESIKRPSLYFQFNKENPSNKFAYSKIPVTASNYVRPYVDSRIDYLAGKFGLAAFANASLSGFRGSAYGDPFVEELTLWDGAGDLPFSFSLWVKKTANNGVGNNIIWGFTGIATGTNHAYSLTLNNSDQTFRFHKYSTVEGLTKTRIIKCENPIQSGEWYLVQFEDDGNGNEKFYLNNVEELTSVTDDGHTSMSTRNPYGLSFLASAGSNAGSYTMIGGIDDFALWNGYILKEREREHIWNNGNGRQIR